jgi:hypothetical protein
MCYRDPAWARTNNIVETAHRLLKARINEYEATSSRGHFMTCINFLYEDALKVAQQLDSDDRAINNTTDEVLIMHNERYLEMSVASTSGRTARIRTLDTTLRNQAELVAQESRRTTASTSSVAGPSAAAPRNSVGRSTPQAARSGGGSAGTTSSPVQPRAQSHRVLSSEPTAEPATEPASEPVTEPAAEPTAESTAELASEPAAGLTSGLTAEPTAELITGLLGFTSGPKNSASQPVVEPDFESVDGDSPAKKSKFREIVAIERGEVLLGKRSRNSINYQSLLEYEELDTL